MLHVHIYLSPCFLTMFVPLPSCVMSVCLCVCVYMWMCMRPAHICSLPHPGGLASVLHRRCSSLPQSHLAPLPKRPPPPQACIPTTTTSTSTTITAPPHLPPTTPNHSASTLPEKTNQLFLFFPSSPSFSHFLPNLYVPPSPLFFLPHFTLLIVSYIIILFILSTLHVVCLA